jgi:fumarate hydratase class I
MIKTLKTPISDEDILSLHIGDVVELYGIGVTSRDMAHKYMVERLIERREPLNEEDQRVYDELKSILNGGFIYHSGPIVRFEDGRWRFVSSGPTTSIRTEVYQHRVIEAFNVKVIIGKGGMGDLTLNACKKNKSIYLHGIGGAGVLNAEAVVEVLDVFKKDEFGLPEAIWKIRVEGFTGIVTMDAHGRSLHEISSKEIKKEFEKIIYS